VTRWRASGITLPGCSISTAKGEQHAVAQFQYDVAPRYDVSVVGRDDDGGAGRSEKRQHAGRFVVPESRRWLVEEVDLRTSDETPHYSHAHPLSSREFVKTCCRVARESE